MADFQSRTKLRLAQYKREVLNVHEDGIWLRTVNHTAHFANRKAPVDILSAFRDQFWTWFPQQNIRLHSDFHHLNSSQALCFNLFFPLLMSDGEGLPSIVKILGLTGPHLRRTL